MIKMIKMKQDKIRATGNSIRGMNTCVSIDSTQGDMIGMARLRHLHIELMGREAGQLHLSQRSLGGVAGGLHTSVGMEHVACVNVCVSFFIHNLISTLCGMHWACVSQPVNYT